MYLIHTALSAMENSVTKFENSIEECRMLEDEAHQMEEEASPDQPGPEEKIADVEVIDQEELGAPESSSPQVEANAKDPPPQASEGDIISPEEECTLLADTPQLEESSPGSETARVSGEMAELWLTSPACPELRRERPHRSLPFSGQH